jgi:DNA polymerase-3 subunit alpha (Gram-positive type)
MYTVVDIETTGLSKHMHQITEIAAARVRNGKIVEQFESLVNPQVHIPSFITRLTGISDSMVRDAPTINKVMPQFVDFVGKDIFVAHNATFDYGFLEHNARMQGHRLENERLCTRKLANRLFPELPRKRLGDLCGHLNIQNVQAHRAMGDVQATALVFNEMLGILQTRGVTDVSDVLKFERTSGRKVV